MIESPNTIQIPDQEVKQEPTVLVDKRHPRKRTLKIHKILAVPGAFLASIVIAQICNGEIDPNPLSGSNHDHVGANAVITFDQGQLVDVRIVTGSAEAEIDPIAVKARKNLKAVLAQMELNTNPEVRIAALEMEGEIQFVNYGDVDSKNRYSVPTLYANNDGQNRYLILASSKKFGEAREPINTDQAQLDLYQSYLVKKLAENNPGLYGVDPQFTANSELQARQESLNFFPQTLPVQY